MAGIVDYKKEHKDLYLPAAEPVLVEVPAIAFAAFDGKGDPNEPGGEYKSAVEVLYTIQYTIKMSKKGTALPKGYFDYVVPPLEGLWRLGKDLDLKNKAQFTWTSMIRLPEYADKDVFAQACDEAAKKKKTSTEKAYFFNFTEGLCVQCMHTGAYNEEPKTLKLIDAFIRENNLQKDLDDKRRHHEIYLSDPKKTAPEKMKTVLRIPVRAK